MLLISSYVFVA